MIFVGYKSGNQYCIKNVKTNDIFGTSQIKILLDYIEKFYKNPYSLKRNNDVLFVWIDENGKEIFSSNVWYSVFNFLATKKLLDTLKSVERKLK